MQDATGLCARNRYGPFPSVELRPSYWHNHISPPSRRPCCQTPPTILEARIVQRSNLSIFDVNPPLRSPVPRSSKEIMADPDNVTTAQTPTLSAFIMRSTGDHELALLTHAIQLACKAITRAVRKAGEWKHSRSVVTSTIYHTLRVSSLFSRFSGGMRPRASGVVKVES